MNVINYWDNTSTGGFSSTSNSEDRRYVFLRDFSGFPPALIFGSPMACTTGKMSDLDGPSCLGISQTWCFGTVFGSVPACRKEWEEASGHTDKVRALSVYYQAGDLYLGSHQTTDNELLVKWWVILASGRLLGSLITD